MNVTEGFLETVDTCIVVPCFNEAARVLPDAFVTYTSSNPSVGFVFVDDGSTDRTNELLGRLCDRHPERMAMLTLPTNQGKAEAVRQGIQAALGRRRTRFTGYWDADLATPLAEIDTLRAILERRASIDIVLGIRMPLLGHRIRRGRVRGWLGRIFSFVVSLPLGSRFRDTQCGAKLFRVTPGLRGAVQQRFVSAWIFDVELVCRCRGFDRTDGDHFAGVHEQPVEHWTSRSLSKVKPWSYGRALLDVPQVWYRARRDLRN